MLACQCYHLYIEWILAIYVLLLRICHTVLENALLFLEYYIRCTNHWNKDVFYSNGNVVCNGPHVVEMSQRERTILLDLCPYLDKTACR